MDDRPRLMLIGYSGVGGKTIRRLTAVARAAGAAAPLVPPTRLIPVVIDGQSSVLLEGRPVRLAAAMAVGENDHVEMIQAIFRSLEMGGIRLLNETEADFRAQNRFLTASLLAAAAIATPPFALASHEEELPTCARLVGFPLVVASLDGSPDIRHCASADADDLLMVAASVRRSEWDPLMLSGLPVATLGWRVLILAGRVLAAVPHRPLYLGPSAVPEKVGSPPRILRASALAVMAALGLFYGAVDFVISPAGPLVIDVDVRPDIANLEEISGRDLATPIVTHLLARALAAASRA